jgi:hypothetical protein
LVEGCWDALVLWGELLVDGHNRYGICQKHGLPFQTVQNTQFQSMEDVHLWMIDQHLGRRSVSDFQRGVLALRKREILTGRMGRAAQAEAVAASASVESHEAPVEVKALQSREGIAKVARLSSNQVVQIEKIQKQATPELVDALKAGAVSLNAAAAVASLPQEEQKAAVLAGKEELKLAAKRVREARRRAPAPDKDNDQATTEEASQAEAAIDEVAALQAQVVGLQAENAALRQEVEQLRRRLGE